MSAELWACSNSSLFPEWLTYLEKAIQREVYSVYYTRGLEGDSFFLKWNWEIHNGNTWEYKLFHFFTEFGTGFRFPDCSTPSLAQWMSSWLTATLEFGHKGWLLRPVRHLIFGILHAAVKLRLTNDTVLKYYCPFRVFCSWRLVHMILENLGWWDFWLHLGWTPLTCGAPEQTLGFPELLPRILSWIWDFNPLKAIELESMFALTPVSVPWISNDVQVKKIRKQTV